MAGSSFSTPATNNSRIADASRTWQAACDGAVTGWNKADEFIAALIAECGAHSGATETFKVQWSKDEESWNDLGTTGELVQGDATVLVNCTSPVGASSGCQTLEDSHEVEAADSASVTTTGKTFIEIQVAIDSAGALDGQIYYFRLYSVTAGAAMGRVTATLTTAAGALEKSADDAGGGAEALLKERETGVSTVGSGTISVLPEKERSIGDVGSGEESLFKFVIAEKSTEEYGDGAESVDLLKIAGKSVSDSGGGLEAIARDLDSFVYEIGGGLMTLLKERDTSTSDSGYGSDAVSLGIVYNKHIEELGGGIEIVNKETGEEEKKVKRWPWEYVR